MTDIRLWPGHIGEREPLTNEARTELKNRFGADYSESRLVFVEQNMRKLLSEEGRELRQHVRELQERKL